MERTDWLEEGFTQAEARFLMVTAVTHHRFGSKLWGEEEIRKLQAELAEIDAAGDALLATQPPGAEAASVASKPLRPFRAKGGWVFS